MVLVTVMDVREGTEIILMDDFWETGAIRAKLKPYVTFNDQLLEYNGRLIPLTYNCPLEEVGIKLEENVTINLYRRIPPQQIDVKVLFRGTILLRYEVQSTESVLTLKNKIHGDQSLRPSRQKLESYGLTMLDNNPIDDYIIDPELPMFHLEIAPPEPESTITVNLVISEMGYENEIVVDAYDDPKTLYLMAIDEGLVDENDKAQRRYYFTDNKNCKLPLLTTFHELGIQNEDSVYLFFGRAED